MLCYKKRFGNRTFYCAVRCPCLNCMQFGSVWISIARVQSERRTIPRASPTHFSLRSSTSASSTCKTVCVNSVRLSIGQCCLCQESKLCTTCKLHPQKTQEATAWGETSSEIDECFRDGKRCTCYHCRFLFTNDLNRRKHNHVENLYLGSHRLYIILSSASKPLHLWWRFSLQLSYIKYFFVKLKGKQNVTRWCCWNPLFIHKSQTWTIGCNTENSKSSMRTRAHESQRAHTLSASLITAKWFFRSTNHTIAHHVILLIRLGCIWKIWLLRNLRSDVFGQQKQYSEALFRFDFPMIGFCLLLRTPCFRNDDQRGWIFVFTEFQVHESPHGDSLV